MSRRIRMEFLLSAAAVAAVALVVCGCGGRASASASAAPAATQSGKDTVGVSANGTIGQILVDSRGRTLYLFEGDAGEQSACRGTCEAIWPPVRANVKATAGSGISASKLGTITRTDGEPQVTYNGHPLYRFSGDQKPGDVNGEGVNQFGAPWYALSPPGVRVLSASGTSTPSKGGNGY